MLAEGEDSSCICAILCDYLFPMINITAQRLIPANPEVLTTASPSQEADRAHADELSVLQGPSPAKPNPDLNLTLQGLLEDDEDVHG
jgi:hypothetical protein